LCCKASCSCLGTGPFECQCLAGKVN
jgi:hypothetical protein